MNLELFPDLDPSALDDLLHDIDVALDACFLSDVARAFESAPSPGEHSAEAPAAA